jgi:membrane fusion protein, copper/silver efflux system
MKPLIATLIVALTVSTTLPIASADDSAPALAPIHLSPERQQLIGLRFATVERRAVSRQIDTTGTVEVDEQLQSYVQTRFAGWTQQVFVNQSFQQVHRGEPLFTVYSPDLASTEQEYLIALQARDRVSASSVEGVSSGAKSFANAAAERLELMGVPHDEIARLERERKARSVLTIDSPATGYVVERNALPNMYVQPDTKLYSITDFSTVWVYAAIFQDEISGVKVGAAAVLTIDAYPGESFAGRVDYIWPTIDEVTRTARVRLAFANRDGKLKPGMYARAVLKNSMGEQTIIPQAGVMRTGTHNVVFVDRGDGYLTPRDVTLGPRVGDDYVVLRGLQPGARIVSSANFLIDSESQLQAATGSFLPPPEGVGASAVQQSAILDLVTRPNPPQRGKNQLRVTLKDSHGRPLSGAQVTVTFYMAAMPAMGMAAMRDQATPSDQGGGVYLGDLQLESGGTWQVTAVATMNGLTVATKQLDLSATGGM